jgi:Fe-S oxidoreductase
VSAREAAAREAARDAAGDERAAAATRGFIEHFGRTAATYLESCIHCGMCAEACHFYEVTRNPKYTPVWKLEPFKQAYKREYGPFAPVYRLLNLKPRVTTRQLEQWQELLYDSCTLCGRCSLICPMGIDIAGLIGEAREGMSRAGLAPAELSDAAARVRSHGNPLGHALDEFAALASRLSAEHGVAIPLDKPKAAVLCTVSTMEMTRYPESLVAMARVMNHLGIDWTLRSDGLEATNAGVVSGDTAAQKLATLRIVKAALSAGTTQVVVPECGHAYSSLRWQGANHYGAPLPFRVLHVSEFLAEQVTAGRLRLRKLDQSVTFHDPCQVSRRGGAIEAPRVVLDALGVDLREMEPTRGTNWCCGGGGGVVDLERATPLRLKAFRIKMEQVDATGADFPVVSCATCRRTFDEGATHHHWDKRARNLLELVAQNLDAPPRDVPHPSG